MTTTHSHIYTARPQPDGTTLHSLTLCIATEHRTPVDANFHVPSVINEMDEMMSVQMSGGLDPSRVARVIYHLTTLQRLPVGQSYELFSHQGNPAVRNGDELANPFVISTWRPRTEHLHQCITCLSTQELSGPCTVCASPTLHTTSV